MKILVVDGLLDTRLAYIEQLKGIAEISSIKQCVTAEDAVYKVFDEEPDIIISSEILSFRKGFSIAKILNKTEKKIPLIIVAKDSTNAINAIKSKVFDFIVCPNEYDQIHYSVKKAVEFVVLLHQNAKLKIFEKNAKIRINTSTGYKLLYLDTLAYCIADGSYTKLFYSNSKVDYSSISLGKIDQLLARYHFVRINRSIIVNMRLITSINKHNKQCILELETDHVELQMGSSYLKAMEYETNMVAGNCKHR